MQKNFNGVAVCEIDLSVSHHKLKEFRDHIYKRIDVVLKVKKKYDNYLNYVTNIKQ